MAQEIVPQAPLDVEEAQDLDRLLKVTETSAEFVGTTWDEYERACLTVGRVARSTAWWIGDLLVYGESMFGEESYQAEALFAVDPDTLNTYVRVAAAIPPARRVEGLSFSHHKEVSARWLTPEERWKLLSRAKAKKLKLGELREIVRSMRPPGVSGSKDGPTTLLESEPSSVDLRGQIRHWRERAETAEAALREIREQGVEPTALEPGSPENASYGLPDGSTTAVLDAAKWVYDSHRSVKGGHVRVSKPAIEALGIAIGVTA